MTLTLNGVRMSLSVDSFVFCDCSLPQIIIYEASLFQSWTASTGGVGGMGMMMGTVALCNVPPAATYQVCSRVYLDGQCGR